MEMPASPSRHRQSDVAAVPQEPAHPSENNGQSPGSFSESSSGGPAPFFQNTITTSSCLPNPVAPTAPGENHVKVFDKNVDRGPFQSSFITCPNTDRSSLIRAYLPATRVLAGKQMGTPVEEYSRCFGPLPN